MKSHHADLAVGDTVVLNVGNRWLFAVITHRNRVTIPADEHLLSEAKTLDVLYAGGCAFAQSNGLRIFPDEDAPIHQYVKLFPPLFTFGRRGEETALGRALKSLADTIALEDVEARRQVNDRR